MRFVSHIRGLQIILVPTAVRYTNYGDRIVDREGYIAVFQQGDVTEQDLEFAEKEFAGRIRGRTTEMDEVTLSPLLGRISIFDTDEKALAENWDADFKRLAEQRLVALSNTSEEFALVAEAALAPPWPNYMQFDGTLEELVDKIVEDGYELGRVLAYERSAGNRTQVIEALQARLDEQNELVRTTETISA